eukprot:TRINITY_DN4159_c0_g1_i5.p1 TRINITY_DN4159_c0_g1~~TRINITY_DN4159_c0_g1_i5.p1  ORF type:complete len:274 (-),score=2.92 TRINITY_DN4159_c0_g1_i5:158-979(-)
MDLLSVQCTCKDLNSFVVHDRHLWRRITIPRSLSEKLTDTHLMVLIQRAHKELEVVEIHGSKKLTGEFLLTDGMKENKKLEKVRKIVQFLSAPYALEFKHALRNSHLLSSLFRLILVPLPQLWLLECPKLSGGALVSLVGRLAQACHEAGVDPALKSVRLAGSTSIEGRHVRLLERFVPNEKLDIAACPHCPKAGHVMMCGVYSMMNASEGVADVLANAIVRDGEIGCENCLVQCCLCAEYFCRAHLFRLDCGVTGVCCRCCAEHTCSTCDAP